MAQSIERPILFGRFDVTSDRSFYFVCLVALVLALHPPARRLRATRSGRVFIAQRDNVRAAQALGVVATRAKLAAFALSGAIAALAGALYSYQVGAISPTTFSLQRSIDVFVFAIVGGIASPYGAVLGAVVLPDASATSAPRSSASCSYIGLKQVVPVADQIALATGVLIVLAFFPGGLAAGGRRAARPIPARRCVAAGCSPRPGCETSVTPGRPVCCRRPCRAGRPGRRRGTGLPWGGRRATTACRCCSASTCTSARARCSRCSAPTARASRRCCGRSAGCHARRRRHHHARRPGHHPRQPGRAGRARHRPGARRQGGLPDGHGGRPLPRGPLDGQGRRGEGAGPTPRRRRCSSGSRGCRSAGTAWPATCPAARRSSSRSAWPSSPSRSC